MTTTTGRAGPGLEIHTEFGVGRAVIAVRGEVDMATAPDLAAALNAVIDRAYRDVTVDLAGVTFFDGQGLQVLTRGVLRLGRDGRFAVANPAPMVRKLLCLTGLDQVLEICDPQPGAAGVDPRS